MTEIEGTFDFVAFDVASLTGVLSAVEGEKQLECEDSEGNRYYVAGYETSGDVVILRLWKDSQLG